jgi:hypothetical protein
MDVPPEPHEIRRSVCNIAGGTAQVLIASTHGVLPPGTGSSDGAGPTGDPA